LRLAYPEAEFFGVGAEHMQAQGLKSLFDMRDLSVMGLAEVLPSLTLILKRLKQTKAFLNEHKPDIIVSIDAPDFSFRVQKAITAPLKLHYVAPTVWAWRPKRAKRIARFLDGVACLFDFEPPYFEREGLASFAVGHPMTRQIDLSLTSEKARKRLGLDEEKERNLIAVFFGSRQKEAGMVADHYAQMMAQFIQRNQHCKFLMPVFDRLKPIVVAALNRHLSKEQINNHCIFIDPKDRYMLMRAVDYAVATSGTVGLELAYAGTPHCIAYRMGGLSYWLAKKLVKTPFAHIGNIICGREVFKEFLQDACTGQGLEEHVRNHLGVVVDQNDLTKIRAGISAPKADWEKVVFFSIDDHAKEVMLQEYKRGTLSDTALALVHFIDQRYTKKRLIDKED
jgi:lipid-A-disaccharide synthase